MPWSADDAMKTLWSGLSKEMTGPEMREHIRTHLQAAFQAGQADEVEADSKVFAAFTTPA